MSDQTVNVETPEARLPEHRTGRRPVQPVVVLAFLLIVLALVSSWAVGHHGSTSRATVSVNGSATVTGKPDTIKFQIGVHTVNPSSSQALDSNNAKVQALIKSLERTGIKRADIQTSAFNLYQNYNTNGTPNGYAVDDTLSVTSHDLAHAGATIDQAVRAAGNGVSLSGVSLSIANEQALLEKARSRAVVNARATADQLAKAAGAHITGVTSLTDQENVTTPTFMNAMKGVAAPSASNVPVQAGTESVTVQVAAVFTMAN